MSKRTKKKSKFTIYYIVLNLALVALVGFLVFRTFFPAKKVYPEPVTLLSENLTAGDSLKIIDPEIADNSDTISTYHFSIENTTTAAKTYYLYLEVTGDKTVIDTLTVKIKEKNILISYLPNFPIKTVTLQPGEKSSFTVKVYIDLLQTINPQSFYGKSIALTISDDYASFYGLNQD